MPKLIDYSGRFDQIREAVFDIALRDGPHAISLPSVAAELGLSVSSLRRVLRSADALPRLGLQWVEIRQRKHLFERLSRDVRTPDALRRWVDYLFRLVPATDALADELRVMRSLIEEHARDCEWAREARDHWAQNVDVLSTRVVSCLEMSEDDSQYEYERLRALLEGVTALICAGRLAPEAGASTFRRHVGDLIEARPSRDAA